MTSLDYLSRFCQSPVDIIVKGVPLLLPCGKCPHCRTQRSRILSEIIKIHSLKKQVFFFTLTYADDTLPVYSVNSSGGVSLLSRSIYSILRYKRIRDASLKEKKKYHSFISKTLSKKHSITYNHIPLTFQTIFNENDYKKSISDYFDSRKESSEKIALLTYRDVQLFFKKFRKKIASNFTYTCTCEYGGLNNRPHYHILLFFQKPLLIDNSEFLRILCDSWGKSSSDSYDLQRPHEVAESLSSYLTDYCTSTTGTLRNPLLNILTRFNSFRQKTRHSTKLLLQVVEENREFFYENPGFCYSIGFDILSDTSKYKRLPSSAFSYFFPKPYDFADSPSLFNKSLFISSETKKLSNSELIKLFSSPSAISTVKLLSSLGIKIYNYEKIDLSSSLELSSDIESSTRELFELFKEKTIGLSYSSTTGNLHIASTLLLYLSELFISQKNRKKYIYRLYSELCRLRANGKYFLSKENTYSLISYTLFLDIICKLLYRLIKWELISRKFLNYVYPYFNSYATYLSDCLDFYKFVDSYKLKEFYSFMEQSSNPDSFFYNNGSDKSYISDAQNISIYNRSLSKQHNNKHFTFNPL